MSLRSVPIVIKREPYKYYPKGFKLEALQLVEESDRPASEIVNVLDVGRYLIYKWKEKMEQSGDTDT